MSTEKVPLEIPVVDIRVITITWHNDGDSTPTLDLAGIGDFEALGILDVMVARLREACSDCVTLPGYLEDDDEDNDD